MAKVEGYFEGFSEETTINQQTVKLPATRNHRLVNTFRGVVICFVGTPNPQTSIQLPPLLGRLSEHMLIQVELIVSGV